MNMIFDEKILTTTKDISINDKKQLIVCKTDTILAIRITRFVRIDTPKIELMNIVAILDILISLDDLTVCLNLKGTIFLRFRVLTTN